MKLKHQLIMNIGKTANDFILTKEMVLNSINTFQSMPIVYNKQQEFKDYRGWNIDNYKNEIIIGYIIGNIEVTNTEVFADIMIYDKYKDLWKGKYDNWCIQLDNNKFKLDSIEVF